MQTARFDMLHFEVKMDGFIGFKGYSLQEGAMYRSVAVSSECMTQMGQMLQVGRVFPI